MHARVQSIPNDGEGLLNANSLPAWNNFLSFIAHLQHQDIFTSISEFSGAPYPRMNRNDVNFTEYLPRKRTKSAVHAVRLFAQRDARDLISARVRCVPGGGNKLVKSPFWYLH